MSEPVGTDQSVWSGRVSVYRVDDGGVVIAYQQDGSEDVGNHHLPAFIVKMLEQASEGKGRLAKMLGSHRGD